jgi:uncharacterized membrane protein YeaQ/YmgE (transglycosylase-associated protein family)
MPEFSPLAQHWVNVVLIWIGFGALAGMLARALLPMGDSTSRLPVLTMGIVGSAAGLGVLSWVLGDRPLNPISPSGFLSATAGALILLAAYRAFYAVSHRNQKDAEPAAKAEIDA